MQKIQIYKMKKNLFVGHRCQHFHILLLFHEWAQLNVSGTHSLKIPISPVPLFVPYTLVYQSCTTKTGQLNSFVAFIVES